MMIDTQTFFTKSENVWVSENFQNLLIAHYAPTHRDELAQSMSTSDLQEIESDVNIEGLVFKDADAFLEDLASLIQRQLHGEEGRLLNDSSANYFFLRGKDGNHYSILVRWEQAQKLWRCGAYLQEELTMPNIRIFRPL